MPENHTLAGIIRFTPQLEGTGHGQTLAELLETSCHGEAARRMYAAALETRLTGTPLGPRQHKLRANLEQIQADLEVELAGLLRKSSRD